MPMGAVFSNAASASMCSAASTSPAPLSAILILPRYGDGSPNVFAASICARSASYSFCERPSSSGAPGSMASSASLISERSGPRERSAGCHGSRNSPVEVALRNIRLKEFVIPRAAAPILRGPPVASQSRRRITTVARMKPRRIFLIMRSLYPPLFLQCPDLLTSDRHITPWHFCSVRAADRGVSSFARNEHGISRLGKLQGVSYRYAPIHDDCRPLAHAVSDIVHDLFRIFIIRVLVRDYHFGRVRLRDMAHDRTLPRVAPSARCTQHANLPDVFVRLV